MALYDLFEGMKKNSLMTWLSSTSASATTDVQNNIDSMEKESANKEGKKQRESGISGQLCVDSTSYAIRLENNQSHSEASDQVSAPPMCHLDVEVIRNLPPELFSELNKIYGGKLVDLITKSRVTSKVVPFALRTSSQDLGKGDGLNSSGVEANRIQTETKSNIEKFPTAPISGEGSCNVMTPIPTSGSHETDLLPSSLSQVDPSVLQELPEPLRADILKQLPPHRGKELSPENFVKNYRQSCDSIDSTSGDFDSLLVNNLWSGNPPLWVDKFKASSCMTLKFLSEIYSKSRSPGNLYGILHTVLSQSRLPLDANSDGDDGAVYGLCELLKQYFKLKIEFDIEEVYVCFRLLKRLAMKSKLFLEVFDVIDPYLQGSVSEIYGGNLKV